MTESLGDLYWPLGVDGARTDNEWVQLHELASKKCTFNPVAPLYRVCHEARSCDRILFSMDIFHLVLTILSFEKQESARMTKRRIRKFIRLRQGFFHDDVTWSNAVELFV